MSVQVVEQVKAELEARGVDLFGPCGAFQIVKRVAWELRGEGAGLLAKPGGNNCEGFAVDIVCWADGRWVDCLISSGVDNGPAWNVQPPALDVPGRWRPPIDPGDVVVDPDPPPPHPPSDWVVSVLLDLAGLAAAHRESASRVESIAQTLADQTSTVRP
jgi:hypothetical protein